MGTFLGVFQQIPLLFDLGAVFVRQLCELCHSLSKAVNTELQRQWASWYPFLLLHMSL